MAHVADTVESNIHADMRSRVLVSHETPWLLLGSLPLIALSLYVVWWLFPPSIQIDTPSIQFESDRYLVTSQITNYTIHPVVLRLRFKIFRVTDGKQRYKAEEFGRKEIGATLVGSASVTAKCEFPYKDFSLSAAEAEVQLITK